MYEPRSRPNTRRPPKSADVLHGYFHARVRGATDRTVPIHRCRLISRSAATKCSIARPIFDSQMNQGKTPSRARIRLWKSVDRSFALLLKMFILAKLNKGLTTGIDTINVAEMYSIGCHPGIRTRCAAPEATDLDRRAAQGLNGFHRHAELPFNARVYGEKSRCIRGQLRRLQ